MRRLNATDATMLYQEHLPSDYAHCIRVTVLEPPDPAESDALVVRDALTRVLSWIPLLTWRLAPTPLGLHHPLWVTDPDLDFGAHIRRIGCPRPGTARELAELVSEIAGRPLDRARPLWEVWIVDGLEGGNVAIVTKIHHALADGVATAQLFHQAHTSEPRSFAQLSELRHYPRTPVPSRYEQVRLALHDIRRTVPPAFAALRRRHRETRQAPRPSPPAPRPARGTDAPGTLLIQSPDPGRRFAFISFSLSEVKAVGAALGASINDVFLAVCAGAIRRLLLQRGELPDSPVIASVPVSTRTAEELKSPGNHVGALTVRLATDFADPLARLLAIKADIDVAKTDFERTRGARPEDVLGVLPPLAHRLLARAVRARISSGRAVMGNVALSNIPGPRQTLYLGQMKVASVYGIGPVIGGVGLNITAWSYVDQFNVSLLSGSRTVPDLWPLTDLLHESFDELRAAALGSPAVDDDQAHEAT